MKLKPFKLLLYFKNKISYFFFILFLSFSFIFFTSFLNSCNNFSLWEKKLEKIIKSNEEYILYFGIENCKYCNKTNKFLNKIINKKDNKINFKDSSNFVQNYLNKKLLNINFDTFSIKKATDKDWLNKFKKSLFEILFSDGFFKEKDFNKLYGRTDLVIPIFFYIKGKTIKNIKSFSIDYDEKNNDNKKRKKKLIKFFDNLNNLIEVVN